MRKKQLLMISLVLVLILPFILVNATPNVGSTEKTTGEQLTDGEIVSKDEVVYATLRATGELDEIYVVNILDVTKAGSLVDYGTYSTVKNLTDLSEIEKLDDKVRLTAPTGKFYYQGNMNDGELPWNIAVTYFLNGKEVDPKELVGKDGSFQLKIETAPNENVDASFFENYVVQISLVLSPEKFVNIQAPDAMVANAGKNKHVTFTVMPGQEVDLSLIADVVDFEMDSIEISAIPSSMAIDVDTEGMTDDIKTLVEAIEQIHNGVTELRRGVTDLNKGVRSLRDGSAKYRDGMVEISGASSELIEGSVMINEMLKNMSNSISENLMDHNMSEWDLTDLENLPEGLSNLGGTLGEIADELQILDGNYSDTFNELDQAMKEIPNNSISDEEIERLYESGVDREVMDRLVETYTASQRAINAYDNVRGNFNEMETTLNETSNSIRDWSNSLNSISTNLGDSLEEMDIFDFIEQLEEGLSAFSTNYEEFHNGLISYTNGVAELSDSYRDIHSGIVELANGTGVLEGGIGELEDGTKKLYESTNRLPDQMLEEIDRMIGDFDKSDFNPVSFVSPKIKKINSVQFVIKTEKLKKDKEEIAIEDEEEPKGFWIRLRELFF
ncbi:X-X-X-Leu-X-X-Gly heptad repeat protein [Evansella vedderi]|uniref:X-X-X-Leu-X-X-Gly heptad repeat protein n=1 Tax=Evansella vedderi TaxID=38282 RepID=A0ABT9ZU76_9BACI|nr:YhgE/Pip domain-containing protein [Evansella vedderi]MDQ0254764.1 X-X-X-Leu-X-X-Gly heptad repeat protein [Evansella vedderi]